MLKSNDICFKMNLFIILPWGNWRNIQWCRIFWVNTKHETYFTFKNAIIDLINELLLLLLIWLILQISYTYSTSVSISCRKNILVILPTEEAITWGKTPSKAMRNILTMLCNTRTPPGHAFPLCPLTELLKTCPLIDKF